MISPLLGNVCLHTVIDLWAAQWRRREAGGDMIVVRYADDLVFGFEREAEARRFLEAQRATLEAFALSLHPGQDPDPRVRPSCRGGPRCLRARQAGDLRLSRLPLHLRPIAGGRFLIHRKSRCDRLRATLRALDGFREAVLRLWLRSLQRRGNRDTTTLERFRRLAQRCLPKARTLIPGLTDGSPSNSRGGSRMRESRTYGPAQRARSNTRPYRDRGREEQRRLSGQRDAFSRRACAPPPAA